MAVIDGLVSYWKMDEASGNALDAHGGNALTDNNTVGSASGKINGARDFVAANAEYFSLTDNADLSLSSDQALTITVWVRPDAPITDTTAVIVAKDDAGSNREYLLYKRGDNTVQWIVWDGSAGVGSAISVLTLTAGAWYFIAAWHDPVANEVGLSINDGTPVTTSWTTGTRDQAAPFLVGSGIGAPGTFPWDGLIDELAFFKAVKTSQDRTDLYNAGDGLAYPFGAAGGQSPRSLHQHRLRRAG